MPERAPLHPVNRAHLDVLSDEVGIMQHAIGSEPDPAHGYCVDDVARALQVDLLHRQVLGWAAVADRARRNLRFLDEAFDPSTGRFRNFCGVDGSWATEPGSQDCQGRAMSALGDLIAVAPDADTVGTALSLFERALPAAQGVTALRAQASVLLACDAAMRGVPSARAAQAYRIVVARLRSRFESRAGSSWPWPESRLTYENALPVRALIVAGQYPGSTSLIDTGVHLLDWLIAEQTAPTGHLSPIGNGWWPAGGVKSHFDQQPIEATTLLLAAGSAFEVTGNERYRAAMEQAYAWFLGKNDLGAMVADPATGACGDGLTPTGVSVNQGAESTLMWLTALERIRAMRGVQPTVIAAPTAAATAELTSASRAS